MMEIKDIHFCHHHNDKPVLKGITFQAEKGRLTTILGPNGSGKTTLFRCIAGLWVPQKGDIVFEGKSIVHWGHDRRAKIIAVVPQEHEPPFPYSVFDVVLMGRAVYVGIFSAPLKEDYKKAFEAIEMVGIKHLKDQPYAKISGGERQLVLIARAIAQDSPVMLLDEPTSHLDFKNQVLVLKKVKEIVKERQVTAIMTIHDPNLAMLFSDSIVMINSGSVVADGSAKDVINEENLKRIYGIDVTVISVNGTRVVAPKIEV
ncbi:ABC transporter [Dissulfurispira thermophila]|uniref:ABC transporter n=1 Tax=Dissulfurispira thermophila TaxID=2715679 RepID=A0A7G1H2L4_9BACT|nr:ABC transporter ATP-binding protein [Dissulfurispira thermophila]BCB95947.1 ABC transporter [Dissulfurispira thermophila]